MTQQQAEYITAIDRAAVAKLREYARRHAGATTDAEFIAWVESVVKVISADEWQRVKKIMESDAAFNK